jgi:hypothetical protein
VAAKPPNIDIRYAREEAMGSVWPVFGLIAFIWMMTRHRRRYYVMPRQEGPDPRDEQIARLSERVRTLERIITDNDWQLRRDIDGLGR